MPSLMRARRFAMPEWQRTLWIMFFAQLASATGFSIIFPFLPLYVADLGTHTGLSIEFWAGMVFSSQAITMTLVSPLWGALADRYGRKLMVQRALAGAAVTLFLMAFVRTAEELVLLRAVQGFVTGTVAAANALVAAKAPRERMGYAMGVLQVGLWGGVAVGPVMGGFMADAWGFRVPFILTAGIMIFAAILVQTGIHEEITPETKAANKRRSFWGEWRHILTMPGVTQTYAVRFFTSLNRSMIIPVTPLFVALLLINDSGVNSYTGLVVGLSSAAATLSAVYLGWLGDRVGHRRVLIWSAMTCTVLTVPHVFVTAAWQLLVLQTLIGLASGGIISAPGALLARYTEPGEEGAVYGLDNSVVSSARALAPLAGAMIAAWFGLRVAFGAMGVVLVVVVIITLTLLPRHEAVPPRRLPAETPPDLLATPVPGK